jgi:acyl-CoA thioesterase FadM
VSQSAAHASHTLTVWHEFVSVGDGHDGHVDAGAITKIMVDACVKYLTRGLGLNHDEVFTPTARPIVAETSAKYLAPMHTDRRYCCTVGANSRSSRSLTLRVEIDEPEGASVAAGEIRLVTIDPTAGRVIPVPSGLADAIERAEGHRVPLDEP